MRSAFRIPTAITLVAIAGSAPAATAQEAPMPTDTTQTIGEATESALAWLALVDAGQLGASWDSAATAFRQAVGKADWETAVRNARGQFEPFGERSPSSSQYTTSLPNAPAGEYVILRFRTAVAGARHVTETVVPMRDADGAWRVSGYFVQP